MRHWKRNRKYMDGAQLTRHDGESIHAFYACIYARAGRAAYLWSLVPKNPRKRKKVKIKHNILWIPDKENLQYIVFTGCGEGICKERKPRRNSEARRSVTRTMSPRRKKNKSHGENHGFVTGCGEGIWTSWPLGYEPNELPNCSTPRSSASQGAWLS